MPQVKFGSKTEPAYDFKKSDNMIAVRTVSTRSVRAGAVRNPAVDAVSGSELVMSFPEAGVEVYKINNLSAGPSLENRKSILRRSPDVRFAGGVLVDEQTGEPVLYTENLFVKFVDEVDGAHCRKVIADAGLTIKREVTYATNAFFVEAPEGTGTKVFDIALALLARTDVEYCHPEVIRKRESKAVFSQQWHLKKTKVNGVTVDASASVVQAHKTSQGQGITIAIIDDGIDIDHIEFQSPGKIVAPRDITLRLPDPRPKDPNPFFPDNHGTACAGVACADGFKGAIGVAPKARLMPIRVSNNLGSQDEADAFFWAVENGADIISCSWGPIDGEWFNPDDAQHHHVAPIPANTRLAIDYATSKGRGGKGCVIVFAAGNGNESVDNDGYASYERVLAVAACNDRSSRSIYSDFGKAVWCCFPSNDFPFEDGNHPAPLTKGIWTTDRGGQRGYNPGKPDLGDAAGIFTNSFGGTSSACPGVAGVAALVLSVNPNLRWFDVKEIIKKSCEKIDAANGNYDEEGRSDWYGYGRVNAAKAVAIALQSAKKKAGKARQTLA